MMKDALSFLLESETVAQGLVLREAPALWVIILVIVPFLVGFTVLFYRMGREASRPMRVLLTTLRLAILFLVAALLMDPTWRTQVVEQRKTLVVVLVDVSASMGHRDDYANSPELAANIREAAAIPDAQPMDAHSRLDLVKQVLDRPGDPFLTNLMQ